MSFRSGAVLVAQTAIRFLTLLLVTPLNNSRYINNFIYLSILLTALRFLVYRIQDVAFNQLVEVKHQTKLGLHYTLSRRKHFVCAVDVRPIQLMLPFEGAAANIKYELEIRGRD